jgi:hypothetical protein
VWKISFSVGSERIRLILTSEGWTYEDAFGSRKYKDDLLHSAPAKIYTTGRIDLANIIAKETSGVRSATPEQSDFELADKFLDEISNRKDL